MVMNKDADKAKDKLEPVLKKIGLRRLCPVLFEAEVVTYYFGASRRLELYSRRDENIIQDFGEFWIEKAVADIYI